MNWSQRLDEILHYRLFELGRQGITLSHLLLAVIALGVAALIARMIRRFCARRLPVSMAPGARYTITRLSQGAVWAVGILFSLKALNIDLTEIALVAGALGVGIGLGLQNMVENFVAGVVILFAQPIKVNDRVTIQNIEGDVVEINFRSTTILTNDNITMIVPNSSFINSTVVNWSHGDPRVRLHVPVGVAYGSDVALVTATLLEAASRCDQVLKEPPSSVWYTGFGDSSLNFDLLVWTNDPHDHYVLQSRLRYEIDEAFRRKGIEMPFPQRDLHIRTAPGLSQVFPKVSTS
ncbi:MAG: mechanosensitive ion channel [Acidobacteria bacterium]|nr:mechanosensitive ion channel [Acidobacteriota bacterium]